MRSADPPRTPESGGQARALILASSSRYRRDLLRRLGLDFSQEDPAIDESTLP